MKNLQTNITKKIDRKKIAAVDLKWMLFAFTLLIVGTSSAAFDDATLETETQQEMSTDFNSDSENDIRYMEIVVPMSGEKPVSVVFPTEYASRDRTPRRYLNTYTHCRYNPNFECFQGGEEINCPEGIVSILTLNHKYADSQGTWNFDELEEKSLATRLDTLGATAYNVYNNNQRLIILAQSACNPAVECCR